mgnify:CR=1 FL=1
MKIGQYILSLDQGTTSSRAVLFDALGGIAGMGQREFTQIYPQPGYVAHDAVEILQTPLYALRHAVHEAEITAEDIAAINITNQRETTIVWSKKTGKPIYRAIVWQDRRTAAFCERLHDSGFEPLIHDKTGLCLDPYFSASKVRWILDNVEGAREKALAGELLFGTVDSWLIWNLTGGLGHVTDVSNASRTLLFNIHNCRWDEELLDIFGIPASMLPRVVPSSGLIGRTARAILGAPIDICGAAGEQQAATFGQTCFKPGMTKNTYGTGGFLLMNTGSTPKLSDNRLLSTIGWTIPGATSYALEGSVFVAGAVVQWLREGVGLIDTSAEIESLARQVKDNGGVYLIPAFVGLGAPYWDPHARGLMIGLTRGTTRAHIARAALESITFQCHDVLRDMMNDAGARLNALRVAGGASDNALMMQFQADISGVPVVRPEVVETTALGAAYLAGLGCGVWKRTAEIDKLYRRERTFETTLSQDQREFITTHWGRAVARSKGWEQ